MPEPTVRLLLNDPVVPVTAPVRGPTNPAAVATPAAPTEYATPTASCPPDTLTPALAVTIPRESILVTSS